MCGKRRIVTVCGLACLVITAICAAGLVDETFTYQGQLKWGDVPVTDVCEFEFGLWQSELGTSPSDLVAPVLSFIGPDAIQVTNGHFTVALDFGAGVFDGNERFLEIAVKCPSQIDFVTLSPRQPITSAPHAAFARWSSWYGLMHVPPDLADGDATLSEAQVENYVTNGPIDLALGTTINGQSIPAGIDGHSLDAADGSPVDAIYVDEGGWVGIGTTNPLDQLSVQGTVKIATHPASTALRVEGNARFYNNLALGVGSVPGVLSARLTVDGGGIGLSHGQGVLSENVDKDFPGAGFSTGDDNLDLLAGGLSRIRILTDGRVGVGTLTPSAGELLDVNGRIRSRTGGFKFPDGTVQTTAANDHHSLDAADGSPADAVYVSSLGFVGINTQTPSNHLTVNGSTYLKGRVEVDTATTVTGLTVKGRTQLNEQLTVGDDIWLTAGQGVYVLNGAGMKTTAANDLDFYSGTSGTQRMRIAANGRVGIGTTSPQNKLEVSDGMLTLDSGTSGGLTGIRIRENGDNNWTILYRTWQDDDLEIYNEMAGKVAIIAKPDNKVGIGTETPGHPFEVGTNTTNGNGAYVTNGGNWTNTSDRNTKKNFEPVDQETILDKVVELPVTQWQYKGEGDNVRHIGPTAQDFHAAFGLGDSERHIGTLDADGVALASIQALDKRMKAQQHQFNTMLAQKDAQIAELRARLARLEQRMQD